MDDHRLLALLDANVLISYLLRPDARTAPVMLVEAAVALSFRLLFPTDLTDEIRERAATKPYLVERITPDRVERLIDVIGSVAVPAPRPARPYREIGSDRKDDYLFAHALAGGADYLVSGDRGVLAVGRVGSVAVVSPADLVAALGLPASP